MSSQPSESSYNPVASLNRVHSYTNSPPVGSLGSSCRYKRFLSCLGCSKRSSAKYFILHPTLFHFICPHSNLGRQSCRVACLLICYLLGTFCLAWYLQPGGVWSGGSLCGSYWRTCRACPSPHSHSCTECHSSLPTHPATEGSMNKVKETNLTVPEFINPVFKKTSPKRSF